jgi:hypothetical protein
MFEKTHIGLHARDLIEDIFNARTQVLQGQRDEENAAIERAAT